MSTDRRGFVRARYVANLRRIEVVGSEEEKVDSCADASGEIPAFPASSSFSRRLLLLLCGGNSVVGSASCNEEFPGRLTDGIDEKKPYFADRSFRARFAEK